MSAQNAPRLADRRTFLKRSAVAVGAASLGGAFPALGRAATAGTSGTTTLNVMFDEALTIISKPELAAFEKANGCKVVISKYDLLRLSSGLAAGSPPDLVRTAGAPEMPNLIARGLCENLDPYFAKSTALKPANFEPVTSVYRFDGKKQGKGPLYGFPLDYSQDAMLWFNKDLFRAAGVPLPSHSHALSFDELLSLGKRLTTRKNGKIDVFGMDPSWNEGQNQQRITQMVQQQGASLWNSDLTEVDFTQPAAVKALQWWVDWSRARVGTSPLDPAPDWNGPLYNAGRIAIISYGYWFRGWVNGSSSGENTHGLVNRSVFAPSAQFGSHRVDACFNGTGTWIPAKARNKDLAFKFMEFAFGGAPAARHFKGGAGLPPLKSEVSLLPHKTPADKQQFNTQKSNLRSFSILQFSPFIAFSAMEDLLTKNLQPAMSGKGSLKDGIKQLQSQAKKLIDQGHKQFG